MGKSFVMPERKVITIGRAWLVSVFDKETGLDREKLFDMFRFQSEHVVFAGCEAASEFADEVINSKKGFSFVKSVNFRACNWKVDF